MHVRCTFIYVYVKSYNGKENYSEVYFEDFPIVSFVEQLQWLQQEINQFSQKSFALYIWRKLFTSWNVMSFFGLNLNKLKVLISQKKVFAKCNILITRS